MSALIWLSVLFTVLCMAEKITYFSVERPAIIYLNPKYATEGEVSCRRIERSNPVHYCNARGRLLVTGGNNFSVDFYFYEFLTNTYKRSFVEIHYRGCDLVNKDEIFGAAFRRILNASMTCPFHPGYYNFNNMTIPPAAIPRGFPFKKSRIYSNITFIPTNELVASGSVDIELKEINAQKKHLF